MKRIRTPEDADTLLALAETIARGLAEKRERLGILEEVEARLRAGIAAATFAIRRYIAVLSAATRSRVMTSCVINTESQSGDPQKKNPFLQVWREERSLFSSRDVDPSLFTRPVNR